jgi:SAM-dependent methyltransferase
MPKDFETISQCLLCGNRTEMSLPLVPTPPANELLDTKQEQDVFPLNLMKCVACNHLQLDTSVDRERLYRHYLYCSDTSQSNRTYFEGYANQMIDRFFKEDRTYFEGYANQMIDRFFKEEGGQPRAKVLDIASNDGLFLSYFQQRGFKVLGVDPAKNLAAAATAKGIDTYADFFNERVADFILGSHGKFQLITCNNAFAHNDDLAPILKGVKELLTDDGTFVVEVQYAMTMLKQGTFDLLYHEHMHCHHLEPLVEFFEANGLQIYDAEEVATGWGSLRIYATHFRTALRSDPKFFPSSQMRRLLRYEADNFDKLLTPFVAKIESNKNTLVSLLKEIKAAGKTISVLGHPARAMTLSYYFGLDEQIITDVFDDNSLKIGRYSPCTKKKILPTSDIYTRKPDYLLILSWNYAEAMMKTHTGVKEWGGQFIVPLPEAQIM